MKILIQRDSAGCTIHRLIADKTQNVNHFVDISTFTKDFWFKLVQISLNLIKNLTDLRHQHLAGAFFLALIPDNNFELFGY